MGYNLPYGARKVRGQETIDHLDVLLDVGEDMVPGVHLASSCATVQTNELDGPKIMAIDAEPVQGGRRHSGQGDDALLTGNGRTGEDEMTAHIVQRVEKRCRTIGAVSHPAYDTDPHCLAQAPVSLAKLQRVGATEEATLLGRQSIQECIHDWSMRKNGHTDRALNRPVYDASRGTGTVDSRETRRHPSTNP